MSKMYMDVLKQEDVNKKWAVNVKFKSTNCVLHFSF